MSCTEPKPVCFNTKTTNCADETYDVLKELIKTFNSTNSRGDKSDANCVSFDFALLTNIKIAEDEIAEMKSVDQTQQITKLIAKLKTAQTKEDIIKIISEIPNNNSKEIPEFTVKSYITNLKNKLEERWKTESNEFTEQLIAALSEKNLPESKSPYDSYEELRALLKTDKLVDLIFNNLNVLNVDTFVKGNALSFDDMNKFIDLGKYALLKPHEVDQHAVEQVKEVLGQNSTPTQSGGLNTATKLGRAGFIVLGNLLLKPFELVARGLWAAFHYAGAMASGALIGGGFTSVLLTDINKICREVVIEQVHEVSKVLFTNRDEYDEPPKEVKTALSKQIVVLSNNLIDIQKNLQMINDSINEVKVTHDSWVRELVKKIKNVFNTDEDELYDNLLTQLHYLIRTIKSNKGGKKKRTRRNTKHKQRKYKTKRLKRRASIKRRASRGGRA